MADANEPPSDSDEWADAIAYLAKVVPVPDDAIGPPSDSISDLEMFHLNGTVCVAGWDRRTGLCWEGGGPVTPYPDIRRWLGYLIDDAVSNGTHDRG